MTTRTIAPPTNSGDTAAPAHQSSFAARLREIGMFFGGTDRVHQAMRRVVELFEQHQIPYAIIGGMAVNAHRHSRTTQDVDVLVRSESLSLIRQLAATGQLRAAPGRSRRFFEPATGVQFDLLVTGSFPGSD